MSDERQKVTGDRLVDYLYDEMSPSERDLFERRLTEDADLAATASELKQVVALYREGLKEAEPSAAVSSRVLEAAARHSSVKSGWRWLTAWIAQPAHRYAFGAVVSVLVVCGAVVAVYRLKGRSTTPDHPKRTYKAAPAAPHAKHVAFESPGPKAAATAAEGRPAKEQPPPRLDRITAESDGDGELTKVRGAEAITAMGFVDREEPMSSRPLSAGDRRQFNRRRNGETTSKIAAKIRGSRAKKTNKADISAGPSNKSSGRITATDAQNVGKDNVFSAGQTVASSSGAAQAANRERLYRTGVLYQKQGKHKQAANFFAQATTGYPRRDDVILRWAESEIKLGNYAKAERLLAMVKGDSKVTRNTAYRLARRVRVMRARRLSRVRAKQAAKVKRARKAPPQAAPPRAK